MLQSRLSRAYLGLRSFRSGRGVVPEDHPLGLASVAARELWDDVDVLVGVGSRLEMPYMRWGDSMRYERKPSSGPKLVRIDIDPNEMQRFEPEVGIVADAGASLYGMTKAALTQMRKNLAVEWAGDGIRVNAVAAW